MIELQLSQNCKKYSIPLLGGARSRFILNSTIAIITDFLDWAKAQPKFLKFYPSPKGQGKSNLCGLDFYMPTIIHNS
jgi:hypothetical protein